MWCYCGGVVLLWWCGVIVVVFLWWCTKYYSSSTKYYSVLQSTTPYYKVLLQYYSVLQSTTPVLLRTTKYYSVLPRTTPVLQSTTPYYTVLLQYYSVLQSTTPVLLQYYSVLQSTTPVLLRTTEHHSDLWNDVRTTSFQYYSVLRQYYKSFQNEHFVRGFRNFSRNKLPKWSFRARLPQLFKEQASKTSISCEASYKFHRTSFQNERFARCFRQFSQKKLPKGSFRARLPPNFTEQASKTSVSHDASDNSHRKSFQNDHFVRGFLQIS